MATVGRDNLEAWAHKALTLPPTIFASSPAASHTSCCESSPAARPVRLAHAWRASSRPMSRHGALPIAHDLYGRNQMSTLRSKRNHLSAGQQPEARHDCEDLVHNCRQVRAADFHQHAFTDP